MEFLKRAFIENPVTVYVLLALAEATLAVLWFRRRRRALALWLLAPVLAAGAVFTLGQLVTTDRQQLRQAAHEIARDLERCDMPAVGRYLADDFYGDFGPKDVALQTGQTTVTSMGVKAIHVNQVDVEFEGPIAHMTARVTVDLQNEVASGAYPLTWHVAWVKRDGRWLLLKAEAPKNLVH